MLREAKKIQEEAAKAGFDWERAEDVFLKIEEELDELRDAHKASDRARVFEELGDILFSVVNLCRFIGVDPDLALKKTIEKFKERFALIEEALKSRNESMTLDQMDEIWEKTKKEKRIKPIG